MKTKYIREWDDADHITVLCMPLFIIREEGDEEPNARRRRRRKQPKRLDEVK